MATTIRFYMWGSVSHFLMFCKYIFQTKANYARPTKKTLAKIARVLIRITCLVDFRFGAFPRILLSERFFVLFLPFRYYP